MAVEFLHLSDVHLGYRQYNLDERFEDFFSAFMQAVNYAIENEVKFILISGDLFNKSALDPKTLLHAILAFEKLKLADIKTIVIAGNHDRASYKEKYSWLHFLAERDFFILLAPDFSEEGVFFSPYNDKDKKGGFISLHNIEIYGLPYLGSSIDQIIQELSHTLSSREDQSTDFTIVMSHFGLQGEIPHLPGGVSHEQLRELKDKVNYLALGHWHKPYQYEDWIYNPGSLENCSMDERDWIGGFYHITIDGKESLKHKAVHIKTVKRPFYRLIFDVSQYKTPEDLKEEFDQFIQSQKYELPKSDLDPVIEVSFEGILSFDRISLEIDQLQDIVEKNLSPLVVKLKNNSRPTTYEITYEEKLPRIQLEHNIMQDQFAQDSIYKHQADHWASLAIELKNLVLSGELPEAIVAALRVRVSQIDQKE